MRNRGADWGVMLEELFGLLYIYNFFLFIINNAAVQEEMEHILRQGGCSLKAPDQH